MMTLILTILLFAQSAGELYQQGLVQENGVGNLQKAIELYQRAAKEAKDDRTMAALALEGAARARQKLGQAEVNASMAAGAWVADLSKEIAGLDGQYTTLVSKYTLAHPQLQALIERIGTLSRALQIESQRHGVVPVAPGLFASRQTDPDEEIRFTGVVRRVEWINPHVLVGIEVQEPNGNVVGYTLKGPNPRALVGAGIAPKFIPAGDTVSVEGLRSRENPLVVGFATVTMSNGLKIFLGNSNFP